MGKKENLFGKNKRWNPRDLNGLKWKKVEEKIRKAVSDFVGRQKWKNWQLIWKKEVLQYITPARVTNRPSRNFEQLKGKDQ